MDMCESYLTLTYLKIYGVPLGITKRALLPSFYKRLWLFGEAKWGWPLNKVYGFQMVTLSN